MEPDTSLQRTFFLGNSVPTSNYYGPPDGIIAYDQNTFLPTATLPLNMLSIEGNTSFTGVDLVRWGQDGLAALTSSGHLYLLRGAAVVPQLMNQNSAAVLSSSSVTTVAHGSGNTLITLTGSNFVPGVAVNWNGSYRTTTIVAATQLGYYAPLKQYGANAKVEPDTSLQRTFFLGTHNHDPVSHSPSVLFSAEFRGAMYLSFLSIPRPNRE